MKKWFAAWCGLTAACAMTTSCSMMQDDLDDCPTGLYLSFKYDYNLQRADMFNDHVGAVTVYVFDEEGRYVTKQEEANVPGHAPLSSPLYTMRMTLAPGKYKFWYWPGRRIMRPNWPGEVHVLCAVSQVRATRWKERWT